MGEVFDYVDELGPAKIIHVYEPTHNLKAVLVVDNVAAGPAIGGLRMAPDVSTRECARLARAMSLKNASAGLPHGGAKSVLFGDPKMARGDKEQLIRELACALRDVQDYIFGPDMGTDEEAMAWVKDEIGRAVGLPREVGGIPLDEIGATGWGLYQAVDVALSHCGFELMGARVVVQGFGAVGKHAARFLAEKGAIIVGVADSRGTIHNPEGLDLQTLLTLKAEGRSVIEYAEGRKLKGGEVVGIECDIWIPAARPDVVNGDNVQRLKTRLVVQGANIPFTYDAEKILHERGVLVVPDFIANAGGVICAAMEYQGMSQSAALQVIEEKIRANTSEVLEVSKARKAMPRDAALALATARIRRAMKTRRWSIF
ncbi:MAG: Glu/Leu/Phe/Val dehydrogenase [Gammaproteobacteria bacterium]|nr:Glu/Leu/Phe/Val dehydrogenase [Gammaproteobacteria bacterium]MBU1655829.1 Glu/Leu/Phe/Val dehydrogenase [Gammaproteobacteria bacterium]MBU1961729.1 Glu/Leu/Phe/Val dehydrogenase [Gammaproteobacteria bacterium]